MSVALADLTAAHRAIDALAEVRAPGPWAITEHDGYLRAALAEHLAARDDVQARRRFHRHRRRGRTGEADG